MTVERKPAHQAMNWNAASRGKPKASHNNEIAIGMIRDCGGKPGQETAPHGNGPLLIRCRARVMRRSNRWPRLNLTYARTTANQLSATATSTIALPPLATAIRGGHLANRETPGRRFFKETWCSLPLQTARFENRLRLLASRANVLVSG